MRQKVNGSVTLLGASLVYCFGQDRVLTARELVMMHGWGELKLDTVNIPVPGLEGVPVPGLCDDDDGNAPDSKRRRKSKKALGQAEKSEVQECDCHRVGR